MYNKFIFFIFSILISDTNEFLLEESTEKLKKLKINIDFVGASLNIKKSNRDNNLSYFDNQKRPTEMPEINFSSFGKTGILDISSNMKYNFKSINYDTINLDLPKFIPIKFNCNLKNSNLKVNLDSIKVSSLDFDSNVGNSLLDFGSNFQSECEYLTINIGLGSSEIKNFNNLFCEKTKITCNGSSIILNITDVLKKNNHIDLSIGMGRVEINILNGNNLQLKLDQSMMSKLNFEKMNLIKRNHYENEDFNKNLPVLKINTSIGLGSLNINWIN